MSPLERASRLLAATLGAALLLSSNLQALTTAPDVRDLGACAALPKARLRVRLTVASTGIADPTTVIERVVNDTWNPEGVHFDWITESSPAPWSLIDLWVAVVNRPEAARVPAVLGEILFARASPRPLVRVFIDPAIEWIRRDEAARFGTDTPIGNLTLGDTAALLPTALGHIAAHEIGHYVLGSRTHAARGVMQGQYRSPRRMLSSPRPLTLDAANRITLKARLAAGAACGG